MSQDREQVALARRLRGEGRLLRHIAEELGVCVGTASAWTRGVLPYGTPPQSMQKRQGLPLLKRLYREGQSIPEIAASTGIPATTLYDWRREIDLPRNRRSVYVTSEMRQRTHEQFTRDPDGALKREAVRRYSEGETTIEIARSMKVTSVTICAWLRSAGLTPRRGPTRATRAKLRAANLGAKRWNWKGGITPERRRLRVSLDMKIAREDCFNRDNYTCRSCGTVGGKLNAHHIWPFQRFPEWKYEVWNLLTLCKGCHDAFHNAAGGAVRIAIGPFFANAVGGLDTGSGLRT